MIVADRLDAVLLLVVLVVFRLVCFVHYCWLFLLKLVCSFYQLRCSNLEEVHLLEVLSYWFELMEIEEDHVFCRVSRSECFRVSPEEALDK